MIIHACLGPFTISIGFLGHVLIFLHPRSVRLVAPPEGYNVIIIIMKGLVHADEIRRTSASPRLAPSQTTTTPPPSSNFILIQEDGGAAHLRKRGRR
jgi:hypothetical protein